MSRFDVDFEFRASTPSFEFRLLSGAVLSLQ